MKKIIIILFALVLGYFGIQYFSSNKTVGSTPNQTSEITSEIDSNNSEGGLDPENNSYDVFDQDMGERMFDGYACIGEYCDGSGSGNSDQISVVQIPLIIQGGDSTFGCGVSAVFAPHAVAQSTGILNATYTKLFSLLPGAAINGDPRNPLGNYAQLHYQGVSINNSVASVQLAGSMNGGPGHCSLPEIREQVSQAALQFPTVNSVEVYLNGTIYDWCAMDLSDGESGCPGTTQLWIDN